MRFDSRYSVTSCENAFSGAIWMPAFLPAEAMGPVESRSSVYFSLCLWRRSLVDAAVGAAGGAAGAGAASFSDSGSASESEPDNPEPARVAVFLLLRFRFFLAAALAGVVLKKS